MHKKRRLLAHGDYSNISNCPTKILVMFRRIFCFLRCSKVLIYFSWNPWWCSVGPCLRNTGRDNCNCVFLCVWGLVCRVKRRPYIDWGLSGTGWWGGCFGLKREEGRNRRLEKIAPGRVSWSLLGRLCQRAWDGLGMRHAWERRITHAESWWGYLK